MSAQAFPHKMAETAAAVSTGAARKARERRARANARHVLWLASNWQVLASHHTKPATEASLRPADAADEVASLRSELAAVRQELAALKTAFAEVRTLVPTTQEDTRPGTASEAGEVHADVAAEKEFVLYVKGQAGTIRGTLKKSTPLCKPMNSYCSRFGLQASRVGDDTAEKIGLEDEGIIYAVDGQAETVSETAAATPTEVAQEPGKYLACKTLAG